MQTLKRIRNFWNDIQPTVFKDCGLIGLAAVLFLHYLSAYGQDSPVSNATGEDLPSLTAPLDVDLSREAILADFRKRLARLHATKNADFDYAAFRQLTDEVGRKLAENELDQGTDKTIRFLAKRTLLEEGKDQQQIEHWIYRFRQFN